MVVYGVNLAVVFVFLWISRKTRLQSKNVSMVAFVLALSSVIFIAGFRVNVGTDYMNYVYMFEMSEHQVLTSSMVNVGFYLTNKILNYLIGNPQSIFVFSAIVTYLFLFLAIRRETRLYEMGVFLFFALYEFYTSMNIMRQWIAIAIVWYGMRYIEEKKYWKYIALLIVATSFHPTAICCIALLIVPRLKLDRGVIIKAIFVTIIGVIFGNKILSIIMHSIPFIDFQSYEAYLTGGYQFGNGALYLVVFCIVACVLYVYRKPYMRYIKNAHFQVYVFVFSMVIVFLAVVNPIFSRLSIYFVPSIFVVLPNLITLQSTKQGKMIMYLCVLVLGVINMYRLLNVGGSDPLPYHNYFWG